jgi:Zn-dependent protease
MKAYTRIKFASVFGARVHVHWSALAVIIGILVLSIRDPVIGVVTACSYFGIILLHECGHAYLTRVFGYHPSDVYLGCVHGRCEYEAPYDERAEAMIAWGGVVAQLLVAVPLITLAQLFPLASVPGFGPVVIFLGYVSIAVALINLAPSRGFDGSMAWRLFPILWADRKSRKRRRR